MPIDFDEQKRVRAIVARLERRAHLSDVQDRCVEQFARKCRGEGVERITLYRNGTIHVKTDVRAKAVGNNEFVDPDDPKVRVGGWL
jgi:hypothetical protein